MNSLNFLWRRSVVRLLSLLVLAVSVAGAEDAGQWQRRWLYLPSNLYVNENLTRIEGLLDRARAVGYNGVLFTDYKSSFWWELDDAARWKRNAGRLREMTRERGMELAVAVFPFGYAGSLLWHDPNLASGVPVKDAPLVARGGVLVPEATAVIANGGFEQARGDRLEGTLFQDGIGQTSFVDHEVKHEGGASLRFEKIGSGEVANGRVCYRVKVRPWQQYRLRVWLKAEDLDGGSVRLTVIAGDRTLQWQYLQAKSADGERLISFENARHLTTDWVEQRVTFNSLENTEVNVYAGVWGGRTGRIWWDDLRIDAVPTLNLLRRDSLPIELRGEDGTRYEEGRDFARIVDPRMGHSQWSGEFETRHEPPVIQLTDGSRIREGQRLRFSGYHTLIVHDGQVNCSLDDPEVFRLCEQQVTRTIEALDPDVFFMSHDEIRTAGWEPAQERFGGTGPLLAENARRCQEIIHRLAPGKPVSVWSDMFDPNHNAHGGFYLVKGNLAGSWEGLDPSVIVMNWGGGSIARPGLEFFAGRGHGQMIAAFYDGDVTRDHAMWQAAAQGLKGVQGVMYTTWQNDYSKLEAFAKAWWGGVK